MMRPFIICHMMVSVDGKIDGDYWSPPFDGTDVDTATKSYYDISEALQCDGEILGRVTVHKHHANQEFFVSDPVVTEKPVPFVGTRDTRRLCVVIDTHGRIKYDSSKICGENIIVVLSETISQAYLEHLRSFGISYVFAGKDGHDLEKAMESLGQIFHLKKVVLQGGGMTNGTFLEHKLIDELSVMIYPGIDGRNNAPTLFDASVPDGLCPAQGQTLELLDVKNVGYGVISLRYKVHH
ncbi:dihydrofolate reductase family protein [uncultured Bartonella sp.]|uniref:dihydrofolate reductase family protein n=1 Tax=uncultured Bartonella sp. TaxID=104108 RepID=UPI0026227CDE|nr:dihydrofolate reductase family protein [uncultured Bartonella sp.]